MSNDKRDNAVESVDSASRRWDWRTWNLLLQIRDATDGDDTRQRHGDMTVLGLSIPSGDTRLRALRRRGWVEAFDFGEVEGERGKWHDWPAWRVTAAGRAALGAAQREGIQIQ
jgi:hypothetical protein